MTSITVNSKQALATYSPLIQEPSAYLAMGGRKIVYVCKQSLLYVGNLVGGPGSFVQVIRKITEAIGPSLAYLGNCLARWQLCAKDFMGTVAALDLLDIINDMNYFFNGSYAKDYAKKHFYSIAGHIALVPANIITVGLYLKDACSVSFKALGAFASSIGNLRVFGFVPKLAQGVQTWPVFRSIPNLTGKAAAVGNVRIFGWLTRVSVVTMATAIVGVAYVYFAVDSKMRMKKYNLKSVEYENKLKAQNIVVKPSDTSIKPALDKLNIMARDDREKVGNLFAKYRHNLTKARQARLDMHAMVAEVGLKAASLGGLVAGATVAGSAVFAVLGTVALFCAGRSIYHRITAGGKPEIGSVI